jgi:tRNA(Phe) wybutosine-synthesizing methylase Tyw3
MVNIEVIGPCKNSIALTLASSARGLRFSGYQAWDEKRTFLVEIFVKLQSFSPHQGLGFFLVTRFFVVMLVFAKQARQRWSKCTKKCLLQ